MSINAVVSADILIPRENVDLTKWAVVACDQYTHSRAYWDVLSAEIGDAPSSLRLILPECYLENENIAERREKIGQTAREYLADRIFDEHKNAVVYVRRTFASGKVREGFVAAIDLDAFSYTEPDSPVLPSEKIVPERLPARIEIREGSPLEVPHIIMAAKSFDGAALSSAVHAAEAQGPDYTADLLAGGGRLSGWVLTGDAADAAARELSAETLIVGDGNHSLAAAKAVWDSICPTLSKKKRASHPKRFCLAEICSLSGEGLEFHPIHRVIYGAPFAEVAALFPNAAADASRGIIKPSGGSSVGIYREVTDAVDGFLQANKQTRVDYIHGKEEVLAIAENGAVGIIMPTVSKDEFYEQAASGQVMPRKSFSIGTAQEKRFYLEARRIG
jgi:uncharacterized protein (DUF1015 family)